MYGVVQFGHSVQYDALSLHHGTLQQTELLLLQLLGQLAFTTGLIQHTHTSVTNHADINNNCAVAQTVQTCCCN